MPSTDHIAAILSVKSFEEGKNVIMATKNGVVKKTDLMAYSNPRSGGIIATTIDKSDELIAVRLTEEGHDVLLGTRSGQSIRFKQEDVRAMGRTARGVRGISLRKGDEVVGMEVLASDASVLTVTERGYGKRTALDEYRVQSRGGAGIITIKTTDRNGSVVGTRQVTDVDDIMIVTNGGKVIRSKAKEIPTIGRNTQGVRLISLDKEERVVSIAKLAEREDVE
jgi:DNA gyrase subunit A